MFGDFWRLISMMRLVKMNEQNAVAVARKMLAAYPSLKRAQKEFRDRITADELRLADYRSPSFDRIGTSGAIRGGFSLVNLQRKDLDEDCWNFCCDLLEWDKTLIHSIPETEVWMVPLLLKIYFGGAGMKRVTAEYRIDYQSFREMEWRALRQTLYAGCGENVRNFNRLRDRAEEHGTLRLIEELLY